MKTFVITLLICLSSNTWAYHKPQHEKISLEAVKEYNRRYTEQIDPIMVDLFVKGVLSEDYTVNLVCKHYNQHFIHPTKKVIKKKKSANRRIKELGEKLDSLIDKKKPSKTSKIYRIVGKLVHYLQDFTNPSHVVPVHHLGGDGFDQIKLEKHFFSIPFDSSCYTKSQLKPWNTLEELTVIASEITLSSLDESFTVIEDGEIKTATFDDFWKRDSSKPWFSDYGRFGNSWGKTHFFVSKEPNKKEHYETFNKRKKNTFSFVVSPSVYRKYNAQQVLLARELSVLALRYVYLKMRN